jgi:hypothetical protein
MSSPTTRSAGSRCARRTSSTPRRPSRGESSCSRAPWPSRSIGAVFLFKAESATVAEAFAAADPYVMNGLVPRWWVRKWPTVVGYDPATPLSSASFR